jgi:flagellar basal-body rod protein FlgF
VDNAQLVALSHQSSLLRQIDILANNVSNASTTGFKSRGLKFQEYLVGKKRLDSWTTGERAVSFVTNQQALLDFTDGVTERTGNALDIALRGKTLLAVKTQSGERYTRNGALTINGQGQLATSDGHVVLGDGGPITVDPADGALSITPDGVVSSKSGPIGKLKIVDVKDPAALTNQGANLYAAKSPLPLSQAPSLITGAIEKSNVSPVLAMSQLIEVNRAYASVAAALQRLDDTKRNAIERLSSIPA